MVNESWKLTNPYRGNVPTIVVRFGLRCGAGTVQETVPVPVPDVDDESDDVMCTVCAMGQ